MENGEKNGNGGNVNGGGEGCRQEGLNMIKTYANIDN